MQDKQTQPTYDENGRYHGMRFFIPVNEQEKKEDGTFGSQTIHVVFGTFCARTNKRRLKKYLTEMGIKAKEHKRVLKAMGFWGDRLGV